MCLHSFSTISRILENGVAHSHGYHLPSSNLSTDMISKMLAEQNILPDHSGPSLNSVTTKICCWESYLWVYETKTLISLLPTQNWRSLENNKGSFLLLTQFHLLSTHYITFVSTLHDHQNLKLKKGLILFKMWKQANHCFSLSVKWELENVLLNTYFKNHYISLKR